MTKEALKNALLEELTLRGYSCKSNTWDGIDGLELKINDEKTAFIHYDAVNVQYGDREEIIQIVDEIEMSLKYNEANTEMDNFVEALKDADMDKMKVFPYVRTEASEHEDMCHMPVKGTDLVIGWKICLKSDPSYAAEVSCKLMDKLGLSTSDLYASLQNIGYMMKPLLDGDDVTILTNPGGDGLSEYEGAALICIPEVQKKVLEEKGEVYVIPSSRHEVLLVKKEFGMSEGPDTLKKMLRSVNRAMSKKDVLSDHIYLLDADGLHIAL